MTRGVLAVAVAALGCASRLHGAGERPPDVVLIVADDLGWADTGAYGRADVRTPAVDRLAREGVRFTRAFTPSPTCSPARSSLFTGLMPFRHGAHPNHADVRPGVRTLPQLLAERGYRVALAGKADVRPAGQFPFDRVPAEVPPEPGAFYPELDPAGVDRFLAAHAKDDKRPLCLVVATWSPHVLWTPKTLYDPAKLALPPGSVDTPAARDWFNRYLSDVTQMDDQVGAVLDSLDRHGPKDALVLFTSDNGAQWPGAKWNLSDAGTRVPLIVRWPGRAPAGATCDALVSLVDVLPTLLDAAGAGVPTGLDGRTVLPAVLGRAAAGRDAVFTTHTGDGGFNRFPCRAVRTAGHKLIVNLHPDREYSSHVTKGVARDGREVWDSWVDRARTDPRAAAVVARELRRPAEELYDLVRDPDERENRAADPALAGVRRDLFARLAEWRTVQGDLAPSPAGERP